MLCITPTNIFSAFDEWFSFFFWKKISFEVYINIIVSIFFKRLKCFTVCEHGLKTLATFQCNCSVLLHSIHRMLDTFLWSVFGEQFQGNELSWEASLDGLLITVCLSLLNALSLCASFSLSISTRAKDVFVALLI